jgi:hypothetical protein
MVYIRNLLPLPHPSPLPGREDSRSRRDSILRDTAGAYRRRGACASSVSDI